MRDADGAENVSRVEELAGNVVFFSPDWEGSPHLPWFEEGREFVDFAVREEGVFNDPELVPLGFHNVYGIVQQCIRKIAGRFGRKEARRRMAAKDNRERTRCDRGGSG